MTNHQCSQDARQPQMADLSLRLVVNREKVDI